MIQRISWVPIMWCWTVICLPSSVKLHVLFPDSLWRMAPALKGMDSTRPAAFAKSGIHTILSILTENSNMLSYATSKYPDRDFVYRGILQFNGDVGLDGRESEDRVNLTANNYGSLECVNGQWYIFYHRHTHHPTYSRQACAKHVMLHSDGSIRQAEGTSCGHNGGPRIPRAFIRRQSPAISPTSKCPTLPIEFWMRTSRILPTVEMSGISQISKVGHVLYLSIFSLTVRYIRGSCATAKAAARLKLRQAKNMGKSGHSCQH